MAILGIRGTFFDFVDDPWKHDQAAALLFGIMMIGDDRAVDLAWVVGKRLYKKAE